MKLFTEFLKDDSGATAIEYGLIAAAIGMVLVTVAPDLTAAVDGIFRGIQVGLTDATDGATGGGATE